MLWMPLMRTVRQQDFSAILSADFPVRTGRRRFWDFRDGLEAAVMDAAGEDAVTFLGGASGLYCGYLDFIAWDLDSVLTAASEFFRKKRLGMGQFSLSAGMWAQLSFWTRKTGKNRDGPEEESGIAAVPGKHRRAAVF